MAQASTKPWYDQVPSLRRSVMLLVALPAGHRELIAKQATEFARSLSFKQGEDDTLGTAVGFDKVVAMMQLKEQGKAFANDPFLMKALNETYKLPPEGRHQVGLKLLLCIQAIDAYEKEPGQSLGEGAAARITLHNIVKNVFNQNLEVFQAQGEIKKQERKEQVEALQAEAAELQAYLEAEAAFTPIDLELETDTLVESESEPEDEPVFDSLSLYEPEVEGESGEDLIRSEPQCEEVEAEMALSPEPIAPIPYDEPNLPLVLNRGPMRFEVSVSGNDLRLRALVL